MHTSKPIDVMILGGGPAGFATAIPLAEAGFTVLLLDYRKSRVRKGEMLAPQASVWLRKLNCWEEFEAGNHLMCPGVISSWGSPEPYEADFITNPFGMGWFIERSEFEAMLTAKFNQLGGEVVRIAEKIVPPHLGPHQWEFELGGEHITARMLVYASGRAPWSGNEPGKISLDKQVAVLRTGWRPPGSTDRDCRLQVEAAKGGWWYLAFYPGGQIILAFMTDADLLPKGPEAKKELFETGATEAPHIHSRLHACAFEDGLQIVPASTFIRKQVAGLDWLAVGDAASGIDPLSGKGISKALGNGLKATEEIRKKLQDPAYSLRGYALYLLEEFQRNSDARTAVYSEEQRWPEFPYWTRRLSQATSDSVT